MLLLVWGCSDPQGFAPYDGAKAYPDRDRDVLSSEQTLAFVSNNGSDTISVVDLDGMLEVATLPVGRNPVDVDGPHHLAIDREKGLLYVGLSYPPSAASAGVHGAHGQSARAGFVQVLSLPDLRPVAELEVEQNPGDIVLSHDSEQLAVTHFDLVRAQQGMELEDRRASLVLVEPAAELVAGAPPVRRTPVCITPHAIAYDPSNPRLFVACTGEDSIAVVDREEASVLERVSVSQVIGVPGAPEHEPYALSVDAAGERLLASNLRSHSLSLFDVKTTLSLRAQVTLQGAPYFAAWVDADVALFPLQRPSGAALVDFRNDGQTVMTLYTDDECENPHEARRLDDGRLFLLCEGNHETPGAVVELRSDTLEIQRRVPVGVYPDRLLPLD